MQKSGVVLGVHDAEADVFAVQAFEGGAVTDHETLTDAGVEHFFGFYAYLFAQPVYRIAVYSAGTSVRCVVCKERHIKPP